MTSTPENSAQTEAAAVRRTVAMLCVSRAGNARTPGLPGMRASAASASVQSCRLARPTSGWRARRRPHSLPPSAPSPPSPRPPHLTARRLQGSWRGRGREARQPGPRLKSGPPEPARTSQTHPAPRRPPRRVAPAAYGVRREQASKRSSRRQW